MRIYLFYSFIHLYILSFSRTLAACGVGALAARVFGGRAAALESDVAEQTSRAAASATRSCGRRAAVGVHLHEWAAAAPARAALAGAILEAHFLPQRTRALPTRTQPLGRLRRLRARSPCDFLLLEQSPAIYADWVSA